MNIFFLDEDPIVAASYLNDKHLIKMILESAQLLCTAISILDKEHKVAYKATHVNHPCNIWVRESQENFIWLCRHALAMCRIYTKKSGRKHKSEAVIEDCISWTINNPYKFNFYKMTPVALCVPDGCKIESAVESYRNYYRNCKQHLAKWTYNQEPKWYSEMKLETSPYEPNVI